MRLIVYFLGVVSMGCTAAKSETFEGVPFRYCLEKIEQFSYEFPEHRFVVIDMPEMRSVIFSSPERPFVISCYRDEKRMTFDYSKLLKPE